jgi:hypothetical protein
MLLVLVGAALYLMKLEEAFLASLHFFFLSSLHDELFELA